MGAVRTTFRVGHVHGEITGPYEDVAEVLRVLGQTVPERAAKNQPVVIRLAAQQAAVNAILAQKNGRHTLQEVVDRIAGHHIPARLKGAANRRYQSIAYSVRLARMQIERHHGQTFVQRRVGRQVVYELADAGHRERGRQTT